MNNQNTYTRTIFVTGGAGFIGSNYMNLIVPENEDTLFVNIDCLTGVASLENIKVSDLPNYLFENVDIRDMEALRALFVKYEPTHLIHFAAESHVDVSIENPNIFVETNVLGTHNLLALSKEYALARFHLISTDEVYGALKSDDDAFTETSPLKPRNPYSASKASTDLMVQAYYETYDLPVVITRSCNVYGPHQDRSKLIPLFTTRLKNNDNVPLYGKGEQMREWIFAEDCVRAIHTVFTRGTDGEIYNIGTGNEMKNIDLTRMLLKIFDADESVIEYVEDRLGHDFRYSLHTEKIESELGWSPQVSFEEGLKRTVDFYLGQK